MAHPVSTPIAQEQRETAEEFRQIEASLVRICAIGAELHKKRIDALKARLEKARDEK
jgi:hypothetical protein